MQHQGECATNGHVGIYDTLCVFFIIMCNIAGWLLSRWLTFTFCLCFLFWWIFRSFFLLFTLSGEEFFFVLFSFSIKQQKKTREKYNNKVAKVTTMTAFFIYFVARDEMIERWSGQLCVKWRKKFLKDTHELCSFTQSVLIVRFISSICRFFRSVLKKNRNLFLGG